MGPGSGLVIFCIFFCTWGGWVAKKIVALANWRIGKICHWQNVVAPIELTCFCFSFLCLSDPLSLLLVLQPLLGLEGLLLLLPLRPPVDDGLLHVLKLALHLRLIQLINLSAC